MCSSFRSSSDRKRLDCYIWNSTESAWQDFETPSLEGADGIQGYIQSVEIPDVGIWFTSAKDSGNSSYMLVRFLYTRCSLEYLYMLVLLRYVWRI